MYYKSYTAIDAYGADGVRQDDSYTNLFLPLLAEFRALRGVSLYIFFLLFMRVFCFAGRISEQGDAQVEIYTQDTGIFWHRKTENVICSYHKGPEAESKPKMRIIEALESEGHGHFDPLAFIPGCNR
jgi:hypothetical protein